MPDNLSFMPASVGPDVDPKEVFKGQTITGDKFTDAKAQEIPAALKPELIQSFEQAPSAPTEKPSRWRVPQGKKKLKIYAFDVYGNLHQGEKYTPEQWEALKARLGAVIEVEATSQPEAWKLYDERKKQGQELEN